MLEWGPQGGREGGLTLTKPNFLNTCLILKHPKNHPKHLLKNPQKNSLKIYFMNYRKVTQKTISNSSALHVDR